MSWSKYKKWLQELVVCVKDRGIKVRFVKDYVTRELFFVGMNDEAAKAIGFAMSGDTIYIDNNLSYKAKCHTLRHELEEGGLMKTGRSVVSLLRMRRSPQRV